MRLVVYALFFLSGACALTYELVWLRWFAAVFGVTQYATAAVVAAIMGGLALGAITAGRRLERSARPLRAYAWMELGLGAYALFVPWLVDKTAFAAASGLGAQVVACFAVLAVPAVLMGATLPALVAHVARRPATVGRSTGRLYALNTAGAVLGTLVAGFVLLPRFGALATNLAAAGTSLGIGALALRLAPGGARVPAAGPAVDSAVDASGDREADEPGGWIRPALAVAALSGLAGIGAEVVWLHVLSIYVHHTIFAYSVTLATFLAGLAAGAAVGAGLCRRGSATATVLAGLQAAFGVAVVGGAVVLPELFPPGAHATGPSWLAGAVLQPLLAAAAVMFVPATLLGATLPIVVDLYARRTARRADAAGTVYAANTVGAIAGSLITGLALVPSIGSAGATLCLAAVASVSAGAALAVGGRALGNSSRRVIAVTAVGLALVAAAGLFRRWALYFPLEPPPGFTLVLHREDASGLVEVLEAPDGLRRLVTDRKHAWGDTSPLMRHSMRRQGYLPLLLHPRPASVVEVGLATGINFAPAILYGAVERAQMVEISPAVVSAARLFSDHNADLLASPKLDLVVADGRNHLRVTGQRYDVVILGLFVPYRPAAGDLFTREMYATARSRLRDGGIVVHWLPLDQLTVGALRSIVRAFIDEFEVAHAWEREQYVALVGSRAPIDLDFDRIATAMKDPSIAADLRDHGLDDPAGFVASYLMGRDALAGFAGDALPNTENSMVVEFQRLDPAKSGAYAYAAENLTLLLEHREFPATLVLATQEAREHAQRVFSGREHFLYGALAQIAGDHRRALMRFQMAAKLNPADAHARFQVRNYLRRRRTKVDP